MEFGFVIVVLVTVCIAALLNALFFKKRKSVNLPPGPVPWPIVSYLQWFRRRSFTEVEAALRGLRSKYGPIIAIHRDRGPLIMIFDHALAHEALVQKGAIFAGRPKALPARRVISSNQHTISTAGYGPTWRLLRRNLTSQILHPTRVKEYSHARKWVLNILLTRLRDSANEGGDGVVVMVKDHLQFAMFCLLVLMCFGDKLDESTIREIEDVQTGLLVKFSRFLVLNIKPWLTRIIFRGRWNELMSLRKKQEEVFVPLIRARKEAIGKFGNEEDDQHKQKWVTSYVDTLLSLEFQDEDTNKKRKLTEGEMVSAASEFLNAGTETTSTGLQWIMANIVKYPHIQAKIFEEMKQVLGEKAQAQQVVEEEDLSKMPYLKAVVLEGLRRHPPGHYVLPHAVTQDVELGGYTIPQDTVINFMVGEMGRDAKVWDDPMEFKPERFLSCQNGEVTAEFDMTGSREIKMMPFGVGRRMCPAYELAMLHMEYFVANLVWNFEWTAVDEVDLSEKQQFTIVMKNPLQARITPRQIS